VLQVLNQSLPAGKGRVQAGIANQSWERGEKAIYTDLFMIPHILTLG